jgi:hypothetical protein
MLRGSRREFLKVGLAGAAMAAVGPEPVFGADPVVGLIFPPANYPVPPEAQQLYPSIRFLSEGVGLERMTPAEYDRVMDRVIPAAIKLAEAVATAYTQEVDRRLKIFLEESGFEVLAIRGLDIERFEDRPPVTQGDVLKLAVSVRETVPQADAMVISCGALRTIDILVPFEERCKLPVVSSNPHGLWDAVRLVGHSGKAPGFGTLLAKG